MQRTTDSVRGSRRLSVPVRRDVWRGPLPDGTKITPSLGIIKLPSRRAGRIQVARHMAGRAVVGLDVHIQADDPKIWLPALTRCRIRSPEGHRDATTLIEVSASDAALLAFLCGQPEPRLSEPPDRVYAGSAVVDVRLYCWNKPGIFFSEVWCPHKPLETWANELHVARVWNNKGNVVSLQVLAALCDNHQLGPFTLVLDLNRKLAALESELLELLEGDDANVFSWLQRRAASRLTGEVLRHVHAT